MVLLAFREHACGAVAGSCVHWHSTKVFGESGHERQRGLVHCAWLQNFINLGDELLPLQLKQAIIGHSSRFVLFQASSISFAGQGLVYSFGPLCQGIP